MTNIESTTYTTPATSNNNNQYGLDIDSQLNADVPGMVSEVSARFVAITTLRVPVQRMSISASELSTQHLDQCRMPLSLVQSARAQAAAATGRCFRKGLKLPLHRKGSKERRGAERKPLRPRALRVMQRLRQRGHLVGPCAPSSSPQTCNSVCAAHHPPQTQGPSLLSPAPPRRSLRECPALDSLKASTH